MDYLIKIVEALAWPVTILILAFGFHRQISKLLLRLSSFKYKDFEARFDEELKKIKSDVTKVIADKTKIESSKLKSLPSGKPSLFDHFSDLAEISPRAAVTEAYRHVEITAKGAANAAGIDLPKTFPVRKLVKELVKERPFSEKSIPVFKKLRKLRNVAAHAPAFGLDKYDAEKYIELALTISENLYDAGNALGETRGTTKVIERDS